MTDENPNPGLAAGDGTCASANTALWRAASVWAAAITFVLSLLLTVGRSGLGIVANSWQGLATQSGPVYYRPLLTTWLAELGSASMPAVSLGALNLLNAILGAVCCALVAAIATRLAGGENSRPVRILCGCTAGLLVACTGAWQSATEGFSPTTLTVSLALAGILCLQRPETSVPIAGVFCSALFVGLATANDPAFGVLALLLAVMAISAAAERYSAHAIVLAYLAGFAIAASIPFIHALSSGEGVPGFLIHALSTPYPTLGDGAPHFGYLPRLTREFSWPTLFAALGGLALLIGKGPSRQTLGWAFVFLTMGPFLPSLTNQSKDASVVTDPSATEAMVLISVSLFAAWGLYAFTGLFLSKESMRARRIVLLALCGLVLAGFQWWRLPPVTGDSADRLAEAVLTDCPQNAILVTGGARIHSLISTVQAVRGVRPDVTVVPVDALDSPRLRQRVVKAGLRDVTLNPAFPPSDALERWSLERPQAVEALTAYQRRYPGHHGDLQELAIWELVRDNFLTRPICFAGVSAPWLSARVQRNGVVLVFPRTGESSRASLDYIVQHINENLDGSPDSELQRTMVGLLLPLSDAARRQGELIQAALIADLARRIAGSDSGPLLASARAAARAGDRKQALAFVEDYLWMHPKPGSNWNLTETIQEELARNALAESYEASLDADLPEGVDVPGRNQLVASLWALDELEVLARGYRKNRDVYLAQRDVDALCDGAAIYTQLGELTSARAELSQAVSIDAFRVWRRLKSDSRFNLLRIETTPVKAAVEG